MGIGQLYKDVLSQLGHKIITMDLDPKKNADFTDFNLALAEGPFDTVHICTPNVFHESIAYFFAPHAKIIFVEKPGVKDAKTWRRLVKTNESTRFMMVKNNQWRNNISELKTLAENSNKIDLNWINFDRVPNPGTWFTNKIESFGGVSRDLMPHLLSIFMAIEPNYETCEQLEPFIKRNWKLSDITSSAYGTVNPNGHYNVDDECILTFKSADKLYTLNANWRSLNEDRINITFHNDQNTTVVPLGLCPEDAYYNMIALAIINLNNQDFWDDQYKKDVWIHERISL